ncbi:ankyrin repeat domain protein [Nitzschia inconspicua]|uniref:Ankyrin repeat domain protein n=1 Tax=Nitzschia inconspicua TaxID=303405 RepID=A0A9K3M1A3_9STRA|nr:ankyrin repeat domain protein [Nitzschia inconspicua]
MEADRDANPTNLYLAIEEKDWDGVKYQAENFKNEAKTWIRRECLQTKKLRWRLLPLHAALLHGAPADTVNALINCYSDAVKAKDDQGMLPIHIAIKKHAEPSVINVLLSSFPDCLGVKCETNGMTPFQMAKSSSSIHRKYYLRALKKGSATHSAITKDPLSDLLCGIDYKSFIGRGRSLILSRF